MIDTVTTVTSNAQIAPGYRRLVLDFPAEINPRPGQFLMLKSRAHLEPLLRRALAVYEVFPPTRLSFLYQVLGRGTQSFASLKPGDQVDCLGPMGNDWISSCPVPTDALIVAGGIGSASVLMLARRLIEDRVPTRILLGAASRQAALGCGLEQFHALGAPLLITTDDGSLGERGLVTQPVERVLDSARGATVYCCGPWAMMKAVASIAERFGNACFASLEAPMGCGFGVCVGCVVAVKESAPRSYDSYKRVCIDGSIFNASLIDWGVTAMSH